jgi:uncharacterized membrane protein YeaQ/YmgE (transglycosylase-associated protein family)
MEIFWIIVVGFVVGVIAKFLMPGKNEPKGFILTTILGIVGAFAGTFLGQLVGIYDSGEQAGFFGQLIGAIVLLALYGMVLKRKAEPPAA